MAIRSKMLAVAGVALLITGVAGCSNPIDSLVKGAIEQQTGISIDEDGGSYTFETEDGTVTVEANGNVPADFPSNVPLPNGKLTGSSASPNMWSLLYEGLERSDIDALVQQIEAAGFSQLGLSDMGEMVQGTFQNGDLSVSLLWSESDSPSTLIYGAIITEQ